MQERKQHAGGRSEEEALWVDAFQRLVPWTAKVHRVNTADAEEIVQEASRQFIDAGEVADPGAPGVLFRALGSRVNGIAVNRRRKKALLAVSLTEDGAAAEPELPTHPETRMVDVESAKIGLSKLLDRVIDDPVLFEVLRLFEQGIEGPGEQAGHLKVPVTQIYNARRRLGGHTEAVRAAMKEEDD